MSTTTSWRFVLDTEPGGPRIGPQGGVALVTGEAAIRQSLLLLLATAPGERVIRRDPSLLQTDARYCDARDQRDGAVVWQYTDPDPRHGRPADGHYGRQSTSGISRK